MSAPPKNLQEYAYGVPVAPAYLQNDPSKYPVPQFNTTVQQYPPPVYQQPYQQLPYQQPYPQYSPYTIQQPNVIIVEKEQQQTQQSSFINWVLAALCCCCLVEETI